MYIFPAKTRCRERGGTRQEAFIFCDGGGIRGEGFGNGEKTQRRV